MKIGVIDYTYTTAKEQCRVFITNSRGLQNVIPIYSNAKIQKSIMIAKTPGPSWLANSFPAPNPISGLLIPE